MTTLGLDPNSVAITCHTAGCTVSHRHVFTDGYTLDQALLDQAWTYRADKRWYCTDCSTKADAAAIRRQILPTRAGG